MNMKPCLFALSALLCGEGVQAHVVDFSHGSAVPYFNVVSNEVSFIDGAWLPAKSGYAGVTAAAVSWLAFNPYPYSPLGFRYTGGFRAGFPVLVSAWGSSAMNAMPGWADQFTIARSDDFLADVTDMAGDGQHWVLGDPGIGTNSIPEPGLLALLGVGIAGFGVSRWRRPD
ncbi:MAG: PEP-CTERM sorting domain-containing protein [Azoarcus sp.]|jgi:hypothetical protein|nr:PEP-CTERM sorting domain-containing protein [Azoarcus sp.]